MMLPVRRRRLGSDPRTVARDIPGLLDVLFPHLVPGVVAHLNRQAMVDDTCTVVSKDDVQDSVIAKAMLFEVSVAMAEQMLAGEAADWSAALQVAISRQEKYYDAQIANEIHEIDRSIAIRASQNLVSMIRSEQSQISASAIVCEPIIPGFQWISSGVGDFAVGQNLIEVKCTEGNFTSSDYRQVMMYWLLSYAGALENRSNEWSCVTLMNPRTCRVLKKSFNELIFVLGGGRSKVEILRLFACMVGERKGRG